MKKFKNFTEMSMSVTLKPKKNNMYKVTKVGDKMKAHGGIKKGEKFHDSDIDGMHDSGIKVKYAKPKKIGEAYEKGRGPTGIAFAIPKGHPDAENPKTRKKYPERQTPEYKANFKSKSKKVFGESIQRRMDRKTIIATDPATGRKVVKIAPKKEIDVGKGKMESVVNEISDKMKMDYIKKAQKKVTGIEKMRDYQNKQMDKKPDSFSKSDKDFVNKKYDQDTLKRRQGMKMAASKLGEDMKPMKKPEYSNKEVRMGKGVAFDKRYKGGNMTGAYKTINKIKKGLGDHPKVADALRRANEEFTTKGE